MSVGLKASLVLQRGGAMRVGGERIALLSAILEHRSISAAARARRMSYRAAWDTVQALNNLFEAPLVTSQAGGPQGGAAVVTPQGLEVIAAFSQLEAELDAVAERLERRLGETGGAQLNRVWKLGLRTSVRNVIRGRTVGVRSNEVSTEVTLDVGDGLQIVSVITRRSAELLQLSPGREALALIKSNFVELGKPGRAPGNVQNRLLCCVLERDDDVANSEVRLQLGNAQTLSSTLRRDVADRLEVKPGDEMVAQIEASNVIIAVD